MTMQLQMNRLPEDDARGRLAMELPGIPRLGSYQVLVVGGGTGGATAAIAAAQEGMRTAVIESQRFLGGIGTGGGIHSYYHGIKAGLQIGLDERTTEWTGRLGGRAKGFHPEAKKIALQEMVDELGIDCYFGCFFVGAVMDGNAIRGVVADGEDGLFWLEAAVTIDCTGDGDVVAASGAPVVLGREGDGSPQPYSLVPGYVDKGVVAFRNYDAGYADPTNALDQTRAQVVGRSFMARDRYDESTRLIYVAPVLGIRESRFTEAEYVITLDDQLRNRRFGDTVMQVEANYDNHSYDYENESQEARLWLAGYGAWRVNMQHDVPYRSFIPKNVENLLVACRALGVTHDAHQLFRMERAIQTVGEVAGLAASMTVRMSEDLPDPASVRDINVRQLQRFLIERQVLGREVLDDAYENSGPIVTSDDDAGAAASSVDELFSLFGSNRESRAMIELVKRGEPIHEEVRRVLASGDTDRRLMAAMVLALQGNADGVAVLREAVLSRRPDSAFFNQDIPRWLAAFFVLESLGLRATGTVDLAIGMLREKEPTVTTLVSAIRALGREGTKEEGIEAIRQAVANPRTITRASMFSTEKFASGGQGGTMSEGKPMYAFDDDRGFEVFLAAAEVLGQWGEVDEARRLASRYLTDEKALVRSYARKVVDGLAPQAGS